MSMPAESQRVLLVHRYFHPDVTTYAQMLGQYAEYLVGLGHEVTVLCGPPTYNNVYQGPPVARRENRGGYDVLRKRVPTSPRRIAKPLGAVVFALSVAVHALGSRKPYDVVSVTTMPPVLMGLVGWLASKRSQHSRFVYHCMDLYPEAAIAQGMMKPGVVSRVAARLDSFASRRADRVIVLSNDMKATLARRGVDSGVAIANNFILAPAAEPLSLDHQQRSQTARFLFAGNLGRFQGIPELIDAAVSAQASGSDIEVVFMGAGALAPMIKEREAMGAPVRLEPFAPIAEAITSLAGADGAIVSLAPGVIIAAFPSKLMTCLEAGTPVLAVVEPDSDLGRLVVSNHLGVVAEPGDPDSIAMAIAELLETDWDRVHIQQVGRREFGRAGVLDHWARLYGLSE